MDLSLDFPSQLWAPFALSRPPIRCSAGYLIYLQNTEATCFYAHAIEKSSTPFK